MDFRHRNGRGSYGVDLTEDSAPVRRKRWLSEAERASLRSTMRTVGSPVREAGQGLREIFRMPRRGPQPSQFLSDEDIAAGLMFADPTSVRPMTEEEIAESISFGPPEGASQRPLGDTYGVVDAAVDRIDRELFWIEREPERFGGKEKRLEKLEDRLLSLEESAEAGVDGHAKKKLDRKIARTKKKIARLQGKLGVESDESDEEFGSDDVSVELDVLSSDLDLLDREIFGDFGITALLTGLSIAAPAIVMAMKGKVKRLKALKKRLEKLDGKAAIASGKKKDKLDRKISKLSDRIERLAAKIGEKESMGLYSRQFFVPVESDDHETEVRRPGVFGLDIRTTSAIRILADRWLGRAGVVGIRDDMWREGPVIIVSTMTGLRPAGMPKRFEGHRIVVVRGAEDAPQYGGVLKDIGKGLSNIGRGVGKAAKAVGQGASSAAKAVGHGASSAAQWTSAQAKKVGQGIGNRSDESLASSFTFAPPSSVPAFSAAQAQPPAPVGSAYLSTGAQPRKVVIKYGAIAEAVVEEMFGSMPADPDEGPWQLQSADAATADGGTIVAVPAVPDARLDPSADRGVFEGVDDFLRHRRRLAFPR